MSRLETEDEQVQALKDWWRKNGTALLSGILVVVLSWSGWTYWQNYNIAQATNASAIFEVMRMKNDQGQLGDVLRDGLKLMEEQPQSPYASAGALMIAKYHLDKGDSDKALETYQWVEKNGVDASLKLIAKLRMVSLFIQGKLFDQAQATLDSVNVQALAEAEKANLNYRVAELAIAQQNMKKAQTVLQNVFDNVAAPANIKNLARLKLDDLAS